MFIGDKYLVKPTMKLLSEICMNRACKTARMRVQLRGNTKESEEEKRLTDWLCRWSWSSSICVIHNKSTFYNFILKLIEQTLSIVWIVGFVGVNARRANFNGNYHRKVSYVVLPYNHIDFSCYVLFIYVEFITHPSRM